MTPLTTREPRGILEQVSYRFPFLSVRLLYLYKHRARVQSQCPGLHLHKLPGRCSARRCADTTDQRCLLSPFLRQNSLIPSPLWRYRTAHSSQRSAVVLRHRDPERRAPAETPRRNRLLSEDEMILIIT